jgi:hypothetical protein
MDRIVKVDKLFKAIIELLPNVFEMQSETLSDVRDTLFWTNGEEILSSNENEIDTLANMFDQLYEESTVTTGYYDPDEDDRNGETDANTGFYYLSIG